jgi:hypothetical protein
MQIKIPTVLTRLTPFAGWQTEHPLKTSLLSAVRTMAPTFVALSCVGVAHAQGTMDFSGATTLMSTFKTSPFSIRS